MAYKEWTPEEDKILEDAVATNPKKAKAWRYALTLLNGRTLGACQQRWSIIHGKADKSKNSTKLAKSAFTKEKCPNLIAEILPNLLKVDRQPLKVIIEMTSITFEY